MKVLCVARRVFAAIAMLGGLVLSQQPAGAVIVLDGNYDADYGAAKSVVFYNPSAPHSNFNGVPGPTNQSNAIGYSIYLLAQGGNVTASCAQAATARRLARLPTSISISTMPRGPAPISASNWPSGNTQRIRPGHAGARHRDLEYPDGGLASNKLGLEFVIPNASFMGQLAGLTYNPRPGHFRASATRSNYGCRRALAIRSRAARRMVPTASER